MQVIHKNKDERSGSEGTNPMDIILCLRWIDRYLEGEHHGGFRNRRSRI